MKMLSAAIIVLSGALLWSADAIAYAIDKPSPPQFPVRGFVALVLVASGFSLTLVEMRSDSE